MDYLLCYNPLLQSVTNQDVFIDLPLAQEIEGILIKKGYRNFAKRTNICIRLGGKRRFAPAIRAEVKNVLYEYRMLYPRDGKTIHARHVIYTICKGRYSGPFDDIFYKDKVSLL